MAVQYVKRLNPVTKSHPVAELRDLTIRMEWDEMTASWVTFVPELNGISTFGDTQEQALDMTRELILVYIESMQEYGMRLPIGALAVRRVQRALEG